MEGIGTFVITLVGGLVMYAIINWVVKEPGRQLQRKFIKLGDLRGKHKDEIVQVVGPPQSISAVDESTILLQWTATGYLIALIFEADICKGINQEIAT
ncbi:hypothetical protein [Gimesia aquarii]|uniref:Uncharacterized protein n=1 Tax=Gimesia aquarii TaxID=2527964 RepID=A0A517W179_9PLAN|nr:hypothetical protein [Gimesia aquarii]QDT99003.1 hypothetical protein V144x_45130 [Gimesia aquarii]